MRERNVLSLPPRRSTTTPLYPLQARGAGTADVESLYGYLLSLAGEHSLPPRVLLEHMSALPTWAELGHSLGRSWDYRHGANLVGVCPGAKRWADLLSVATGVGALERCTLFGVSKFVCGIGLVSPRPRVCLQCLAEDEADGNLPYERLWWRLAAARCCPLHQIGLVEPICATGPDGEASRSFWIPKRSGVCSTCGSVGHKCHAMRLALVPTATDLWIADQVRQLVIALPLLAKADHRHMKDELSHYCAAGDGRQALALRANMTKSQMSFWLRKPDAKTTLAQLLDIALVEQFDLTQMLLGDLSKRPIPGARDPRRVKRRSRRVDHGALHVQLETALAEGKKVSEVAQDAGVDLSTVARHEELYLAVRERTQDQLESADTERRKSAVEEAETVLEILVSEGITPSLRLMSQEVV